MIEEALSQKVWNKPLQSKRAKEAQENQDKNMLNAGGGGAGIKLIRNNIEKTQIKNTKEISNAF